MPKIIPPRRDEILSKKGVGELRFLKYLEENAEQTNNSTESTEADPATVNLSNAQVSQINKKIAEIVSENLISQNALVSKLNKRIEQLENTILSNNNSKLQKQIDELKNSFTAPFYKTTYQKLTIKSLFADNVTIDKKLKLALANDASDPTIQFTNNDGFYQESSGVLAVSIAGVKKFSFSSTVFTTPNGTWSASGINLNTGDVYQVNSNTLLSLTTLGPTVLASSLTSLGSLVSLTVTTDLFGPSGSWNANGVNVDSGDAFSVGGTPVVRARQAAVAAAGGGTVIDVEARVAINDLLTRLNPSGHGLIA